MKYNPFKKKLEIIISKRTFTYSQKGVNLSFTLNIEDKIEMEKFKELLLKAVEDVSEELERKTP